MALDRERLQFCPGDSMTSAPIGQGVIVSQERGAVVTQLHIDFKQVGAHVPANF